MDNQTDDRDVITINDLEVAKASRVSSGVLSRTYKLFMHYYGLSTNAAWDMLVDKYLEKRHGNDDVTIRSKKASLKGNLKRSYLQETLTFKKFLEALKFAGFRRIKIIFVVETAEGNLGKHEEDIIFENIEYEEMSLDDAESVEVVKPVIRKPTSKWLTVPTETKKEQK